MDTCTRKQRRPMRRRVERRRDDDRHPKGGVPSRDPSGGGLAASAVSSLSHAGMATSMQGAR